METLPLEPLEPRFTENVSAGEREEIQKAHRWAYHAIRVVVEGFRTAAPNSRHWQDYFTAIDQTPTDRIGQDWWDRKATVERTFQRMAELMTVKSVKYQKQQQSGCTDGMLGNTFFGQGGPINLCNDAFNDHWLRWLYWSRADWARALIVVHEMAHAVKDGPIDIDNAYTSHDCYLLSRDAPAKAVRNAQNYAYFAMHRHHLAPYPEEPDSGIWAQRKVGGAGPKAGQAPGAAMIAVDILMLAYPAPETPNPSSDNVGGQLHYKTLDLHQGKEIWSDATPFKGAGEILSESAPALAVDDDHKAYCAYIDSRTASLRFISTGTNRMSSASPGLSAYWPTGWSDMQWDAPREIVGNVDKKFGPALTAFTGGDSSGLYAVYVDKTSGLLQCAVLFWGEGFFKLDKLPSGFTLVPFDKPRKSISAPALVLFNGQLKCVYRDEKLGYVTLNYAPAARRPGRSDVKPGTWHEDTGAPLKLDTRTLALAQWNSPAGPALVALGRGPGDDRTLHYACGTPADPGRDIRWQTEVRTNTCRTSFGSALVSYGPSLYAFHQHDDGGLDWLTATLSKTR